MKRRLFVATPLAAILLVVDMADHFLGLDLLPFLDPHAKQYLQLALAIPAVLYGGWPFFKRGAASLRTGNLNMFTLIAIGTGAAFLYSLVAVFAPDLFPAAMRSAHGMVPVYFESAAVIIALVLFGQVLELNAREKTGGAIRALLDLSPKTAVRVAKDGVDRDGGARGRRRRRRAAGPAGRHGADRRRGGRGIERGRRVAADRRAGAGREGARATASPAAPGIPAAAST